MSRPVAQGGGFAVPRPTRVVTTLIAVNVAAYVLQLVLLRTSAAFVVDGLMLTPRDVYQRGFVWQLFTYGWLHAPSAPGHLLMNMLWLWLFGTQMEGWWGPKRFLKAYGIFVVAGGLLTVLVSLLCEISALSAVAPGFPSTPHLGASAASLGVTVSWGLVHAKREMQFFLLGRMTGGTFVLLIVGIEILVALSFSNTSSTAHFGGILAAVILGRGLWRPARWRELFRKAGLRMRKAKLEKELRDLSRGGRSKKPPKDWRVIDGGDPDDPKKWN